MIPKGPQNTKERRPSLRRESPLQDSGPARAKPRSTYPQPRERNLALNFAPCRDSLLLLWGSQQRRDARKKGHRQR